MDLIRKRVKDKGNRLWHYFSSAYLTGISWSSSSVLFSAVAGRSHLMGEFQEIQSSGRMLLLPSSFRGATGGSHSKSSLKEVKPKLLDVLTTSVWTLNMKTYTHRITLFLNSSQAHTHARTHTLWPHLHIAGYLEKWIFPPPPPVFICGGSLILRRWWSHRATHLRLHVCNSHWKLALRLLKMTSVFPQVFPC